MAFVSSISSESPYDADTYSLISEASSMMTIGDSIPAQLVRRAAKKGYTFNIMSVGQPEMNKTLTLSALFGKNLDLSYCEPGNLQAGGDIVPTSARSTSVDPDPLEPPINLSIRNFDIEEKRVKLKLTLAESENYGLASHLGGTHQPLVDYIDAQYAHYYRWESSHNRKVIKDTMVHCLFFFISPYGSGLTKFDLQFLEAVHTRVNIIPIIGKAEVLTPSERLLFKKRIRDSLKNNNINVYQLGRLDMEDPDDLKKVYKDIQDAMPFAITSMSLNHDNTPKPLDLGWAQIDPYNLEHSDFLLLKTMLNMQIPDLCDITHDVFYEEYRLKMLQTDPSGISIGQTLLKRASASTGCTKFI